MSEYQSKLTTTSDTPGQKLIDVLWAAWGGGFSTKSNFARDYADYVAVAASSGLITTHITGPTFGRFWLIAPKGLERLWLIKEDTDGSL